MILNLFNLVIFKWSPLWQAFFSCFVAVFIYNFARERCKQMKRVIKERTRNVTRLRDIFHLFWILGFMCFCFSLSLPSIIWNWPLRKQNFTSTGSKGHGLWFVFGGFRSVLCGSAFQGSLFVIKTMIDGSENAMVKAAFKFQSSRVFEKHSNPRFDSFGS